MDHSKLYRQLREQRKVTKRDDVVENKYDQIISRLEAQLQHRGADSGEKQELPTSAKKSRDANQRYQGVSSDEEGEEQKLNPSEEVERKLMQSSVKEDHYRTQIERLQEEKERIEKERQTLLMEKNQESKEWMRRYQQMASEHEEVISNLKDANSCYLAQVGENEELKKQIKLMQAQH